VRAGLGLGFGFEPAFGAEEGGVGAPDGWVFVYNIDRNGDNGSFGDVNLLDGGSRKRPRERKNLVVASLRSKVLAQPSPEYGVHTT